MIAEVAVALVLLTASGLLLRSFQKMRAVDLGFTAEHTLTASYSLPRQQYSTQAAVDSFNRRLRDRLEALPGVAAIGVTTLLPAAGTQYLATFTPEGYVAPKTGRLNIAWIPEVSGNYFAAQGIRIIRGRSFTQSDNADAPLVVIVNRSLAQHYWPRQNPIGKRLHRGPAEAKLPWLTIVGEIEGVKQLADQTADYQIYVPSKQVKSTVGSFAAPDMLVGNSGSIVLRTSLPPEKLADSLRAVVHSIDPELPVTDIKSMDSVISEGQAPRRFNTALISAFAGAAVLLALLGIYSVVAFSTAMRTQEMAIRLALGAQRPSLMWLVLRSAGKLGLAGCVIGLAVASFSMRLLRSLLFEVEPLDPAVLVLAALSILLLAIGAALIPARRAALIEPVVALRTE